LKFRINAKYFNKEKNKIELFTTFTDKPIKVTEIGDFVKKFLKDNKIVSVDFKPVDEFGNVIGKRGNKLRSTDELHRQFQNLRR